MKKVILFTLALSVFLSSCGEKTEPSVVETEAPVLASVVPVDGTTGIQIADFSIQFKYDQNVKFSGTASISPSTASLKYREAHDGILFFDVSGLNYSTTYTISLPAGSVIGYKENQKKSAAVSTSFTTVDEVKPKGPMEPDVDSEGWENAALCLKNMGTGWNLGNTLDANGAGTAGEPSKWETYWGQPVTKPELIKMFADAGFGAIRVPVTWYEHIDADGNVNEAWMNRVEEIVGYVLNNGLYCILNVHHDTGADSGTFKAWLHASESCYNNVSAKYKKLWEQIATRFNKYGGKLVFESFNEMLDPANTWNDPKDGTAFAAINKYNADFVATVRATGGNNARRNLILNTYAASTTDKTLQAFVLPEDSVEDHLCVEVHSYAPYNFAMNEESSQTTFDASCESEVTATFERLNKYFVNEGIPCVMGEYGATAKRAETEMGKQAACYVKNGCRYGIPCFYWMVLSDGADRSVPKWTKPTLKDYILQAYSANK